MIVEFALVCTAITTDIVRDEIIAQSIKYHVNTAQALKVAKCESSFNHLAKNKNSTAKGVYQFTNPTWEWIEADGSQYDYKENIKQFMVYYPKYPRWWKHCL